MPQLQLPIFFEGVTQITSDLGYSKTEGQIVYYNGTLPIFTHEECDLGSFKMIISQLYINGSASQTQLARKIAPPSLAPTSGTPQTALKAKEARKMP